mmetsp:Transcript_47163/g.110213  ORF Transcript_47163/g.110213 Transcript_47163/m.110213 type:complete len:202 (-) Transcript_47163:320-925(-)
MGGRGFRGRMSLDTLRPSESSTSQRWFSDRRSLVVDAKLCPNLLLMRSRASDPPLPRRPVERMLPEMPAPPVRLEVEASEGRREGAETCRIGRVRCTGLACWDPRPFMTELTLGSREEALKVRLRVSGDVGTFSAEVRLSSKLPCSCFTARCTACNGDSFGPVLPDLAGPVFPGHAPVQAAGSLVPMSARVACIRPSSTLA